MTVFGKGLSRCLFYTRHSKAASFLSPPPPPPLRAPLALLSRVLGLFSNKRASSYKGGLSSVTFSPLVTSESVRETLSNTTCSIEETRSCWGCLLSADMFIRKRTKFLSINGCRIFKVEGTLEIPNPCTSQYPTFSDVRMGSQSRQGLAQQWSTWEQCVAVC